MYDSTVVILTLDKRQQFIRKCIDMVRKEYMGDIHLMISGEQDYLKDYNIGYIKHNAEVESLPNNVQRASKAYMKALTIDTSKGVLIIEDDSIVTKGWSDKLAGNIMSIRDKEYVVSLKKALAGSITDPSSTLFPVQRFQYRVNLIKNPGNPPLATVLTWAGTNAVYYSNYTPRLDMAAFLKKFCVDLPNPGMYDLALGYYFYRRFIPIYHTVPPLVDDLGALDSTVQIAEDRNNDYTDWRYD